MTDPNRPLKITDLSMLGITPEQIENCGLIVVGQVKEELLPPYDNPSHRERALSILKKCTHTSVKVIAQTYHDIGQIDLAANFPDQDIIQVIGAYPRICVAAAISRIGESGKLAYVESRYLLGYKNPVQDTVLGKAVMNKVLTSQHMRALVIGEEKYLYYNSLTRNQTVSRET